MALAYRRFCAEEELKGLMFINVKDFVIIYKFSRLRA